MLTSFLRKQYYAKLSRELRDSKTILDVGCGYSSIVQRIEGTFRSTGVDAYPAYLEGSRKLKIHDDYILADLQTLNLPPHSYDAAISFDVLEHFEKPDSLRLLQKIESWAAKKVIISTPNGFVPTLACHARPDPTLDHLQRHKCGWSTDDFRARGYRVRGLEGIKWFRADKGIKGKIYKASYLVTYFFPRMAFRLLAIKDISAGHGTMTWRGGQ